MTSGHLANYTSLTDVTGEETLLGGQLRQDKKLDHITSLLLDLLNKPDPTQQDLGQRLVTTLILIQEEVTGQRRERAELHKLLATMASQADRQADLLAAISHQLGTPVD